MNGVNFFTRNESVGDISKSIQRSLQILGPGLFPGSDRLTFLRRSRTEGEDRAGGRRGEAPGIRPAKGKIFKRRAQFAEERGEAERRKVCCLCDADLRVSAPHCLLRRQHIGSSLQQGRRQSGRNVEWDLSVESRFGFDRSWVLSQ